MLVEAFVAFTPQLDAGSTGGFEPATPRGELRFGRAADAPVLATLLGDRGRCSCSILPPR